MHLTHDSLIASRVYLTITACSRFEKEYECISNTLHVRSRDVDHRHTTGDVVAANSTCREQTMLNPLPRAAMSRGQCTFRLPRNQRAILVTGNWKTIHSLLIYKSLTVGFTDQPYQWRGVDWSESFTATVTEQLSIPQRQRAPS